MKSENTLKFDVLNNKSKYYDLWNGIELQTLEEKGKYCVELNIKDFGCLFQTDTEDEAIDQLLV